MTTKHLVWDWNGTLFNDFEAVAAATNTAIMAAGGTYLSPDEQRERFRRPIIEYYSELVNRQLTEAEFATLGKEFHRAYLDNLQHVGLNQHARQVLHEWNGGQSLLSMWHHDKLVPLIEKFELGKSFSLVQGLNADYDGHSKRPHLQRHLESLRLTGQQCILIGDTVDDAESALEVGAQVVVYTGGFASKSSLETLNVPMAPSLAKAVAIAEKL